MTYTNNQEKQTTGNLDHSKTVAHHLKPACPTPTLWNMITLFSQSTALITDCHKHHNNSGYQKTSGSHFNPNRPLDFLGELFSANNPHSRSTVVRIYRLSSCLR